MLLGQEILQQLRNLGLVRIPHYPGNAVQRPNLLGRSLRVTASHDNSSAGIRSMDFSNRVPCLRIRRGCDRTGIQHYEVSHSVLSENHEATCEQTPPQRGSVGICGPAAEIFNGESRHRIHAKLNRVEIIAADQFFEAAESFEVEE